MNEEGIKSLDAVQNNPNFDGSLRQGLNIALDQLSHILLPFGGTMPPNADFNDYMKQGWYANHGTNDGQVNFPHHADNGVLIVIGENNNVRVRIRHIWIGFYVMQFKTRTCIDGTWSDWQSFVLE